MVLLYFSIRILGDFATFVCEPIILSMRVSTHIYFFLFGFPVIDSKNWRLFLRSGEEILR